MKTFGELSNGSMLAGCVESVSLFSEVRHVTPGKKPLEPSTIRILKDKLKEEYDFYYFVRQRFHSTLSALQQNN